jgi:Na+/proline symporter
MLIIAIIGGIGMGTSIDWYPDAQRAASTKSVRDAAYSMWSGGLLVLMRNSLWAIAILAFYVAYPFEFSHNAELAWYRVGIDLLPNGLLGFLFVAIVAIHFSTISSHLNLGAMYATRDIYHHYINPHASEKKLVWWARINTLLVLLGSLFFSLMIGEKITAWLIYAFWLMAAGLWLPNILQVIWWRFNAWGYLSAWIANLAISWIIVWVLPALGIGTNLAQQWQFWLSMILCLPIYIICTFLTKPEKKEHLAIFYAITRPLGFWGHIKKEALARGFIKEEDDKIDGFGLDDFFGCVCSVLSYALWMLAIAWVLLNDPRGWWTSAAAIIVTIAMFKLLDPKLKRQSKRFEEKQPYYKKLVEQSQRWRSEI